MLRTKWKNENTYIDVYEPWELHNVSGKSYLPPSYIQINPSGFEILAEVWSAALEVGHIGLLLCDGESLNVGVFIVCEKEHSDSVEWLSGKMSKVLSDVLLELSIKQTYTVYVSVGKWKTAVLNMSKELLLPLNLHCDE